MTDKALIKQCQLGDSAAFEALLEQHYDTIYRFAYRWCQDQNNAQDITQLVCMKLAKVIGQYNFESEFSTWLYPIVINCAKDFYKSPTLHNVREQQHEDDQCMDANIGSYEDQSTRRLFAQEILEHINTLQDDLKQTLILIYGTGLNHKQAAEKLNVKESTVSWRVHEARKILKDFFHSSDLNANNASEDARGLV